MPKPSPRPVSTPEREKMIEYLYERAYPIKKSKDGRSGRKVGAGMFLEGLRDQPTNVLESLYLSAENEKERRAKPKREALL
jgi:hypothetical protein